VRVATFEAALVRPEGTGTWTYVVIPFDSTREFGSRARVRVKGTIDGHPFKSTLLPNGEGKHFLVVKKEIRDVIGKVHGEMVTVKMSLDSSPRSLTIPSDMMKALERDSKAKAMFGAMSFSHRKAYVEWIEQAKKRQTREQRIKKSLQMILKRARMR
jgi:hypothetical protein